VVPGETLQTVARDYHVSSSEIVFVNQLDTGEDLSSTDSLVIPVAPVSSSRARLTLYKVEHGDTLVTVADRFNVTVQQLRRWNHLSAARLVPGRRLYVAEPARISRSVSRRRKPAKKHGGEKTARASAGHEERTTAGAHAMVKASSASLR
jgi:membrane-bound lytic murein transglycosylase D